MQSMVCVTTGCLSVYPLSAPRVPHIGYRSISAASAHAQQQTSHMPLLLMIDRIDRPRLLDRLCAVYYVSSINNAQFGILYNTHSCCLNFRASARSCLCSAERTARWCNNSAEIMKPLESNCAFSLSALSISCEYQHYTTLSITVIQPENCTASWWDNRTIA